MSWSRIPPLTREVQFDEKWSFVAKKQKNGDETDPAEGRTVYARAIHADGTAEVLDVPIADVDTVQQDLAIGDVVEPRDQVDEGALART